MSVSYGFDTTEAVAEILGQGLLPSGGPYDQAGMEFR